MTGYTIYYVRHGQTDWNAELRYQGRQDIPLNETGRAQAHANGKKLAALLGKAEGIDFVTTPLGRAQETMEIVRAEMGLDPKDYRIDENLIEASYGTFEGMTLPELKAQYPEIHRQRQRDRWGFAPPQGESHAMVQARILPWLETIRSDTLICGHGVVGRALRQHFLGIDPEEAAAWAFPQDRIFIWRDNSETQV